MPLHLFTPTSEKFAQLRDIASLNVTCGSRNQNFTLVEEGHLRWDSLGEFLALAASLEHLGKSTDNDIAIMLSKTLDEATAKFLESNRSPSRKVNEIDNRGSHFYLAMYWAEALAVHADNPELRSKFSDLAKALQENEATINQELLDAQGAPVDIGGYYWPDHDKASQAMRPSGTLNAILEQFVAA